MPLDGRPTEEIRAALESGELKGLILFGVDPLRDFPDTKAWEAAITAADFVVCFSMHENATTAKADVLFPLETHAEKDGTVTHPDGRLQRVRPSAGRPGDIRPNIQVLAELSASLGHDTGINSQPTAFAALTERGPLLRRHRRRRHRRPRHPLAGHLSFREPPQLRERGSGSEGVRRWVAGHSARQRVRRLGRTPRSLRDRRAIPRPRHLPRPLGRPDHRAEPAAEVPRPRSSAWRSPSPTPSAST